MERLIVATLAIIILTIGTKIYKNLGKVRDFEDFCDNEYDIRYKGSFDKKSRKKRIAKRDSHYAYRWHEACCKLSSLAIYWLQDALAMYGDDLHNNGDFLAMLYMLEEAACSSNPYADTPYVMKRIEQFEDKFMRILSEPEEPNYFAGLDTLVAELALTAE